MSGNLNFMIAFQAVHTTVMHPFHVLGVADVWTICGMKELPK